MNLLKISLKMKKNDHYYKIIYNTSILTMESNLCPNKFRCKTNFNLGANFIST